MRDRRRFDLGSRSDGAIGAPPATSNADCRATVGESSGCILDHPESSGASLWRRRGIVRQGKWGTELDAVYRVTDLATGLATMVADEYSLGKPAG